jgi:hypothetical protein
MTSKTITIEFTQLVLLLCLVGYTVWIWCKSINSCPKSYSEEYITLHKKYNDLLKEHNKTQQFMSSLGNAKVKQLNEADFNELNIDFDEY